MNETTLKNYAEIIVRIGGNVQRGQLVVINCDVRDAEFCNMVEACAYDAGASNVMINWSSEDSTRLKYLRATDETIFDRIPQWQVDKLNYQDENGAVYLHINSRNPDSLADADPKRIKRLAQAALKALKSHSALTMDNTLRWSTCNVPSPAWAKKVFPHLQEQEAVEQLWKYILKAVRAEGDDPIKEWYRHTLNFAKYVDYLNGQQFAALRITTGLGTDLTIGLVRNHLWTSAGVVAKDGVLNVVNIPTEEIFTMPHRERADGHVVMSMPLPYRGNIIEGIELTFENGRVSSYKASKNRELLADIIETDEGTHRLGEIALVANSSPIAQMNTLFYNVLFDENAASHLALGKAYPANMEGGGDFTVEERLIAGGNDSLLHVDFMFGTKDMCVTGIKKDGTEIEFFRDGEFVI